MASGTESRFQDMVLKCDSLVIDEVTVTATAAELNSGVSGLTATAAEINRTSDVSARVVISTATALSLTVTQHAERIVLVNTNSTVANTFTLPTAAGTGAKFEIVNGIAQTQGTVVIAANGTTDVLVGRCLAFDSSAIATHASEFVTSATSDKVTLNLTTTGGGVGYDRVVAYDTTANSWLVFVETLCIGTPATPFSAT